MTGRHHPAPRRAKGRAPVRSPESRQRGLCAPGPHACQGCLRVGRQLSSVAELGLRGGGARRGVRPGDSLQAQGPLGGSGAVGECGSHRGQRGVPSSAKSSLWGYRARLPALGGSSGWTGEGGVGDSPWGRTPSPAGRESPRHTGPGTGAGCCAAGPCGSQQAAPLTPTQGRRGQTDKEGGWEGGQHRARLGSRAPGLGTARTLQPRRPRAPPTCRAAPLPGTASARARWHWPSAPSPPPGCC